MNLLKSLRKRRIERAQAKLRSLGVELAERRHYRASIDPEVWPVAYEEAVQLEARARTRFNRALAVAYQDDSEVANV